MIAKPRTIYEYLINVNNFDSKLDNGQVRYVIPFYQRNYDWEIKNCDDLYTDILAGAEKDINFKHFLGSIVKISTDKKPDYAIVNGQQRITTCILLAKAIWDCCKEKGFSSKLDYNFKKILFNVDQDEQIIKNDVKLRLKALNVDDECLTTLFDDYSEILSISKIEKQNVYTNYRFFYEKIQELDLEHINKIFSGFKKLQIIDVELKSDEGDDPQEVFERINSTGKPLCISDLIRNHLLNDYDAKDNFEKYWKPIEEKLGRGWNSHLDEYLLCYIKMLYGPETKEEPKVAYSDFKKITLGKTKVQILESLLTFSKYYCFFIKNYYLSYEENLQYGEYGQLISFHLHELFILEQNTPYPFLLKIFDDSINKLIAFHEIEKILAFIVAYLLRRQCLKIETNSLRALFCTFYDRVKEKYTNITANNIFEFLKNTDNNTDAIRNVEDDEFCNSFRKFDLYHRKNLCNMLLYAIQFNGYTNENIFLTYSNYNRNYKKNKDVSVEHIMPWTIDQNKEWGRDWISYLGEISWKEMHKEYRNVIGNLTLTTFNTELGNRPYADKQKIYKGLLFDGTKYEQEFEKLNALLLTEPSWNKESISKRCDELGKTISNIFCFIQNNAAVNTLSPRSKISVNRDTFSVWLKENGYKSHETYLNALNKLREFDNTDVFSLDVKQLKELVLKIKTNNDLIILNKKCSNGALIASIKKLIEFIK